MLSKIRLRDVADRAGVSVTTVSNVVRGWPYISDETRLRVEQAIHDLGYVPHPMAQGLRTGRTQVIGFVVPNLANPHFAAMVSAVEDVAWEHGYSVLVFNTHEDETRETDCVRRMINGWGDGLLIAQTAQFLETSQLLRDYPLPVVAIDRVPATYDGAYCRVDNIAIARMAMMHLYELGHRRIAHLSGAQNALTAMTRLEGYRRCVEELKLDYEYTSFSASLWTPDEGYRAMKELLESEPHPTAVFASNDSLAIGAAHAIREVGLRIPEDMSLIGVDDLDVSRYLYPPLTSVQQPVAEMAQVGIDLLLRLIIGETPEQIHISLSPTLVVRRTTGPCAAG
ncbi:LacI family DNA-binding transcriptional regulator [Aggregatilinea lenta]|uniref:LacI family DNA-binding transcriptional regulator n=1 Tax=Aggregatilinea lenta TaxID=913108 RepID=UPI000E5C554D|nr:LacI family DNA-binding transcriptional regulator [Aggregatilinea lenta]